MSAEKIIQSLGGLLSVLTLSRVALAVSGGVGVLIMYALWETRLVWAQNLADSPVLLGGIGVGVVLVAVGATFQARVDAAHALMLQQLSRTAEDLQRRIDDVMRDRDFIQKQLAACLQRDTESQIRMARMESQIRKSASGFGGLSDV